MTMTERKARALAAKMTPAQQAQHDAVILEILKLFYEVEAG